MSDNYVINQDHIDLLCYRYANLIREILADEAAPHERSDQLTPEQYQAFYHLWRHAHQIPRELAEQNPLLEDGKYRLKPMLALMQELLAGGRVLSTREPWSRAAEEGLWLFFDWLRGTVDQMQAYDQAFDEVWQETLSKPVGISPPAEVDS